MRKSPSHSRLLTIFLLVLVLAVASIASADGPNPIRIMPLGPFPKKGSARLTRKTSSTRLNLAMQSNSSV